MIDLIVTSSASRFYANLKQKQKQRCDVNYYVAPFRFIDDLFRLLNAFDAKALGRPCLLLKYSKWDAEGNEPEMPHVFQEEKEIFDVLNE